MTNFATAAPAALLGAAAALAISACGARSGVEEGEVIVLAAGGAANPTVAVDPHSTAAYAAWIETRAGASDVFVARIDSAAHSAAVRANDIAGDAAPHEQAPPQVAVAPDGTVYVIWQNNLAVPGRRFPASNLRFARSSDGGRTFAPAIFVNDDAAGPPTSHTFHDIAVAGDGTIYVSWIDGRERTRAQLTDNGEGHDAHGAGLPGSDVRVARSTDGGRTFTPGVVVYRNVCPCCRTSLAVGQDGRVAVAFRSAEKNLRDIRIVHSADGGRTFGAPVLVHADDWEIDGCPHAGASIAFTPDGRLHVGWYTGAASRQGAWYARSTPDLAAFESPRALTAGAWVPTSQIKLAAHNNGDVWIAWTDARVEPATVRLAVARDGRVRALRATASGTVPAIAAGERIILAQQHGDSVSARMLGR